MWLHTFDQVLALGIRTWNEGKNKNNLILHFKVWPRNANAKTRANANANAMIIVINKRYSQSDSFLIPSFLFCHLPWRLLPWSCPCPWCGWKWAIVEFRAWFMIPEFSWIRWKINLSQDATIFAAGGSKTCAHKQNWTHKGPWTLVIREIS
jgi:hypothetical protein